MITAHPWALALCVTVLLVLLGTTSGLVNARLWMSEPLVCVVAGVLLGPLVLGLINLDPGTDPAARAVMREAARVTLAISVLAAALRLPRGWLVRQWRGLAVALGPGMLLMWAASSAIVHVSLGLTWLSSALIGAILTPTDPVLSAPLVSGEVAQRAVPDDLRHAINAESGANDGLALPLVMLPLLLMTAHGSANATLSHWLTRSVCYEVGLAVVLGGIAGWLARKCRSWSLTQPDAGGASMLTISLALALAVLAGLQAIGANGVLGAFAAGAALNEGGPTDWDDHQEHFNEAVTRFFDLPVMFLLGAAIPWHDWRGLGWGGVGFVGGILLLRRMPVWLLLRSAMPWARRLPDALFAGWFGPIGAAALFYACFAQDRVGLASLWPVVSLAACASVLAHGVTGTHLSLWLGRWRQSDPAARGMSLAIDPARDTVQPNSATKKEDAACQ